MKKILSGLLALTMLVCLLAGCGKAEDKKDLLAQIREKGTITIAMEGNWAPWTYEDENGNLMGFEVEVFSEMAFSVPSALSSLSA